MVKVLMTKAYSKFIANFRACTAFTSVFKNIPIKSKCLILESSLLLQRLIELNGLNTIFEILPILPSTLDTLDAK